MIDKKEYNSLGYKLTNFFNALQKFLTKKNHKRQYFCNNKIKINVTL